MTLFVFGLSHKTANLALREKVAVAGDQLKAVLQDLLPSSQASELALLSTCNRTEFHCISDHPAESLQHLQAWCETRLELSEPETAESLFYSANDLDALKHLIRVGSGLDSMVVGEPQIFGQLKTAYTHAVESQTVQQELHRVYNHVFSVSKRVRSDTGIGVNPVSVVSAAVRLSRRVFSDLENSHALLIGAGETISLAARHLRSENVADLVIANRTLSKAEALANQVQGRALAFASIPHALQQADIVISSTASQLPVIGKGMVEQALKARKNKPIFIVDIAVPRDVEPQVGELDNVYLYTVDDLQDIVEDNRRERESEGRRADEIIQQAVQQFASNQAERTGVHRVRAFRQSAHRIRDGELDKAMAALQAGKPAQEVMTNLANGLTNKFTHSPSIAIKQASALEQTDKLDWAEKMLGFSSQDGDSIETHSARPEADAENHETSRGKSE